MSNTQQAIQLGGEAAEKALLERIDSGRANRRSGRHDATLSRRSGAHTCDCSARRSDGA